MHETNPISLPRRRRTEEIVQNEAKLGATGVCGQRLPSCGAWPGSEMCKTNPISKCEAPSLKGQV
jgi:hypothetical protein